MSLNALLITKDPGTIQTLTRVLGTSGIDVEVCSMSDMADQALRRRKFEAVFIDCDDLDGGDAMLQRVRRSGSNPTTIVFGIINQRTSMRQAFELGANFVLPKPVSNEKAVRSVRAAHGLMVQERRRYFRHPVDLAVEIANGASNIAARMTNVSEGGMALRLDRPIEVNTQLRFKFTIPESRATIEAGGKLVWADSSGRAGVQFRKMADTDRQKLAQWLAERAEEPLPPAPAVN